jgi:uncharacterized membrane protein (DUF485 family)
VKTLMPWLFIYVFGFAAVLTIVYLILLASMFDRLRKMYPETYRELGEPSLFLRNSPKNNIRVLGFLMRREYRQMPDESFRLLAAQARNLLIAAFGLYIIAVLLLAFGQGSIGRA